jgi:hypothetical protein
MRSPAPGLGSTITLWPSVSIMLGAITRAMVSGFEAAL